MAIVVSPALATYAGDRPLITVFSGDVKGSYLFSTGNSSYGGVITPGNVYSAGFNISIPDDATIVFQRYYVYWAWSKRNQQAIYPEIHARAGDGESSGNLTLTRRYSDSKGFAGQADYFAGMDSLNGSALAPGSNHVVLSVQNGAVDNSTFVIQGAAVLAVYEQPGLPRSRMWVKEGCDMLYSDYGITPEMATAKIPFEGSVEIKSVQSAQLEIVAPSGGYSRSNTAGQNALLINRQADDQLPLMFSSLIRLIFPGTQGRQYLDIFYSDEDHQVGTEIRDITPQLLPQNNLVAVRDQGDYLHVTNALLRITYR
ncbi:MAG: DUF3344 domain-containing protein [Methanoregula sp.]